MKGQIPDATHIMEREVSDTIFEKKHRERVNKKKRDHHTANYSCEECEYVTRHKDNFHRHKKIVHLKMRGHGCDLCDRTFRDRCDLKKHIKRIHENIKDFMKTNSATKYSCEECGYVTGHITNFQRHTKFHVPHTATILRADEHYYVLSLFITLGE